MDTQPTPSTGKHNKSHHHDSKKEHSTKIILNSQATTTDIRAPATATLDRIPTETWGPFTIGVVIFVVILTCLILNCNRIRRKVDEHRMNRLGRSGPLSFEKRHKDLQEADLEWNVHPPIVFTSEKLSTPESTYSSKHSSGSDWSSSSSSTPTIAQKHHYQDRSLIKNQPPSVQLRLTLEEASTVAASASTKQQDFVQKIFNKKLNK